MKCIKSGRWYGGYLSTKIKSEQAKVSDPFIVCQVGSIQFLWVLRMSEY